MKTGPSLAKYAKKIKLKNYYGTAHLYALIKYANYVYKHMIIHLYAIKNMKWCPSKALLPAIIVINVSQVLRQLFVINAINLCVIHACLVLLGPMMILKGSRLVFHKR